MGKFGKLGHRTAKRNATLTLYTRTGGDAKKAKHNLDRKKIKGREWRINWLKIYDANGNPSIDGKGDYQIEQGKDKNKIIIRGIVEEKNKDQIILQSELIRSEIWNKLLTPIDIKRLGTERNDGVPRPLLVECKNEEEANEIYLGFPSRNEGGIYIRRYKSRNNLKKERDRRTRWIKRKETRNKIRYTRDWNQHPDQNSHPINQSNPFNQLPQPHPRRRNYYIQKEYEPNLYEHQLMSKQNNQKYRRWAAHNPLSHKHMYPY